jgi:hypothetical protein
LISEYEKKLLENSRYITQLENKIQVLEEKDSTSALEKKSLELLAESESKYRGLYETTLAELEEVRGALIPDANFSKQDVKFSKFVEEMEAVN